jgi:hypothetical protein
MSMVDEVAAPEMADPISNRRRNAIKVHWYN